MASNYLTNRKISASQLCTWIKSPNDYIKQYIEDEPFVGNKYTDFGSLIHKKIQMDEPLPFEVLKLKNREYYFEKGYKKCVLNGFLDSFEVGHIIDYKVSKAGRWSQKLVDSQNQIKFYGLWHFLEYKQLPKMSLIHLESALDSNGALYLTGNQTEYIKEVTKEDIKYIKQQIKEFISWCDQYKKLHANKEL